MIVLVPAYEPDLRLATLIRHLGDALPHARVLVVDDGSGPDYDGVFDVAAEAGASVVRHVRNHGKGHALRAGIAWAMEHAPGEPVVTADCDGQHTPTDIARVADAVAPATIVLGGRRFTGDVPARSRFGNAASRLLFRALSGQRVHDTQTGLRGLAPDILPWLLGVPGDRFEYEFSVLMGARAQGVRLAEITIETIYLDENASSHFRPVRDSVRIYAPALRFAASSLAGAAVDWAALLVLAPLLGSLNVAIVCARLASAATNYQLNKTVVFRHTGDGRRAVLRYAFLAAVILTINVVAMDALVIGVGVPLLLAKVVVEGVLFLLSYAVQHHLVFPAGRVGAAQEPALRARTSV